MHLICLQRGQILPLALAGVVVTAAIMFLMVHTGNKITEKSIVANAADASAYSGAVFVARHLNMMAYTNRAMIANHVGVGHFVIYASWIRYVEQVAQRVDTIANFFPIIKPVTEALREFAEFLRDATDEAGKVFVPAVDELNRFYRIVQLESRLNLALPEVDKILEETARRHDPAIQVNNQQALAKLQRLEPRFGSRLRQAVEFQKIAFPAFVKEFAAEDQNNELEGFTENTYTDMADEWFNERGWDDTLFGSGVAKEFETEHALSENNASWSASDDLVAVSFGKKTTLASGEAESSEFDSNYDGVPRNIRLAFEQFKRVGLFINVYASKDQSQTATESVVPQQTLGEEEFGFKSTGDDVAALAIAVVRYRRPQVGFQDVGPIKENEAAPSLYNPFWSPRLVGVDELVLDEAIEITAEQLRERLR